MVIPQWGFCIKVQRQVAALGLLLVVLQVVAAEARPLAVVRAAREAAHWLRRA